MSDEISLEQFDFYQQHPVEWVEQAFGESLWKAQQDILSSLRDNKRTSVRSSHGIGKSFIAARAILWFLNSFPFSKIITTAPSFRQVEDILWREIGSAYGKSILPLPGNLTQTKLDIHPDWFAIGLSTDKPDRFQGFHAVNILLVVDEAAGVTEPIFEASEGIVSSENAKVLYIGNPTNLAGSFYQSFKQPNVNKIHVSAFDTPNFTEFGITMEDIRNNTWESKITRELPRPYLVTPEWVYDKYHRWGEDNPMWEARVVGNFPTQGEDTLIPLVKIEQAVDRPIELKEEDKEQIGADIARFGSDKTVFIHRKGGKVVDMAEYNHSDTMTTAQRLFDFSRVHPFGFLCVDVVGIGAGVVDRLRQLEDKRSVQDINVGMPSNDPERFLNLRAEFYWNLRERFINDDISIPNDDELIGQLANIRYEYTPKGQIKIQSKEDMKKEGMSSPDKADAMTLAFGNVAREPGILDYMKNEYA